MNKIWLGALVSLILFVICLFGFKLNIYEIIFFIISVYSAILFICFLFTGVAKQIKKSISPYCAFAVICSIFGIGISIFSIYDIKVNVDEWFGGLVGTILLVYAIPFIVFLLIIDFIVWKKYKSK